MTFFTCTHHSRRTHNHDMVFDQDNYQTYRWPVRIVVHKQNIPESVQSQEQFVEFA